jgi:hypothetical protein
VDLGGRIEKKTANEKTTFGNEKRGKKTLQQKKNEKKTQNEKLL